MSATTFQNVDLGGRHHDALRLARNQAQLQRLLHQAFEEQSEEEEEEGGGRAEGRGRRRARRGEEGGREFYSVSL